MSGNNVRLNQWPHRWLSVRTPTLYEMLGDAGDAVKLKRGCLTLHELSDEKAVHGGLYQKIIY